MRKIFTFLCAALMSAGIFAATVTWDSNTLSSILIYDDESFTQDGVTVMSLDGVIDGDWQGGSSDASFKFSTSLGNFTKIEITGTIYMLGGSGWTLTSPGAVWTGEANETTFGQNFDNVSQIVFTIEEPAPSAKYYVVGDMTNWEVNADYEMTPSNEAGVEEYMYDITLTTANQFKVVKVEGETETWYPEGMGNNYGQNGEIKRDGDYTIYFRPALDGDEDWFYNCIMAIRHATPERVVVGVLFPENGKPTEGVKIFGSFSEEEFDMTLIIETGAYIHSEIMAADQDEFMFRDAADDENVLVVRNAEGQWEDAVFTFDEEWEQDTYKGAPVKMIDMDLSDNSKYAWANAIPEGIEDVLTEKAESTKVMIDGMLYIVRDGKYYTVLGAEVK